MFFFFVFLFFILYILVLYCLCIVLCIISPFVLSLSYFCTCLRPLPPGGNTTAVNKYHISYHNHHSGKLKLGLLLGYIKITLSGNTNWRPCQGRGKSHSWKCHRPEKPRNRLHSKHREIPLGRRNPKYDYQNLFENFPNFIYFLI